MGLERLQTILDRLVAERKADLARQQATGKGELAHPHPVIGYFCNYAPRELILAAGAIPIRLAEGGTYGTKVRGERYVRADACPFCKSCLGLFADDPLYKLVSVVVAPSMCDQMRRLPEAIERNFGIPVWPMSVPRTWEDISTRRLFRHEILWLRAQLERLTGTVLTAEALAQVMLVEEEKRSLLRAINDTRRADRPIVTETDILKLVSAANLLRAEDCVAILRQQLTGAERQDAALWELAPTGGAETSGVRISDAGGRGRSPRPLGIESSRPGNVGSVPRLMLAGSIIAEHDRNLIQMVEERAAIVADLLCTGVRSFLEPLTVPVTDDLEGLLGVLADYYFDQPGCIHRRPNTGYYRLARNLIQEFRVTGIVLKTLFFCDAFNFEALRLERELGLPLLHVDTDYGETNTGQLRTRVEAFLETL